MRREAYTGSLIGSCKVKNILNKSYGKLGNEKSESTILMELKHFPQLMAEYLPAPLENPKEFKEWLSSEEFL